MPMIDRAGPDTTKLAATLVREARSLLRRAEKLAAATEALEDPEASHAASEARQAADRLVHQLVVAHQREQRRTREALRREQ
jgi:CHASE3 domain sensor protein